MDLITGVQDGRGGYTEIVRVFDDAGTITYRRREGGPQANWRDLPVVEEREATPDEVEAWRQHQIRTVPSESVREKLESAKLSAPVDLRTFLRTMNRIRKMWNNTHGTNITKRQMIDAIIADEELRE